MSVKFDVGGIIVNKKRLLFVFMAFVLAFTSLAPATAFAKTDAQAVTAATANSILTVANKSIGPVTVTLTGPSSYTIFAPVGTTTKEIPKGTYKYSYKACGTNYSGTLKATGAKAKISIAKCKTANLVIMNFTNSTYTLTLSGPASYYYNVPAHSSVRAVILRGVYQHTGVCGGKSYSGPWAIKGARFYIWCR
jgi:hypothetical protein